MSKKHGKNVIDLDLRRFLKRCDEAADAFPLWVLDADHQPVRATSAMEWGRFKSDFENNCRVAQTDVGQLSVSTVFRHRHGLRHEPGANPV